jgi:hypothetical protein
MLLFALNLLSEDTCFIGDNNEPEMDILVLGFVVEIFEVSPVDFTGC